MNRSALRLVPAILGLEFLTISLSTFITVLFAPRLLLLNDAVVSATAPHLPGWYLTWLCTWTIATLLVFRRRHTALRALARGATYVEPTDLLALYAAPTRVVLSGFFSALAIALSTLFPGFRPEGTDLLSQLELVILAMTFTSVFTLSLFVSVRALTTRVLELAPVDASAEAIQLLETRHPNKQRLRQRVFAAVVAPVAFVAMGASLLVHAQVRALAVHAREVEAALLVRTVIEPVAADAQARSAAIDAAARAGHAITIEPGQLPSQTLRQEAGMIEITTPLEKFDEHAVVRVEMPPMFKAMAMYLLLAGLAIAIAGAVGGRLGAAYGHDVRLATRELLAMGAQDVIRGTSLQKDTRFSSVQRLVRAIDELGGVFRNFASSQERAIEARASAERMRGMFLASMSHDLKTPLNAILGFAELVSRDVLTEGQRESVAIIEQRGRELLYLIETILDAARAEAGELAISPEFSTVGDLIMPAVLDARELNQNGSVQVVAEVQPGIPRMFVDPARIAQALTAVILVAARSVDHGTVTVRATLPSTGDFVCIDVEASGHAIPSGHRGEIFDAFTRAERARQRGSLGLGPWLARTIVEQHKGHVEVSQPEAGSALFRLWIPTERMSLKALDSMLPPSFRPR